MFSGAPVIVRPGSPFAPVNVARRDTLRQRLVGDEFGMVALFAVLGEIEALFFVGRCDA